MASPEAPMPQHTGDEEIRPRSPFDGLKRSEMDDMIHKFVKDTDFRHWATWEGFDLYSYFYRGAFLAQMGDKCLVSVDSDDDTPRVHYRGEPADLRRASARPDNTATNLANFSLVTRQGHVVVNNTELAYLQSEVSKVKGPGIPHTARSGNATWWEKLRGLLRSYPRRVYWLIACCSVGAVVQGFDETAVNGGGSYTESALCEHGIDFVSLAQIFYKDTFKLGPENNENPYRLGLINGAPYAVSAIMCL